MLSRRNGGSLGAAGSTGCSALTKPRSPRCRAPWRTAARPRRPPVRRPASTPGAWRESPPPNPRQQQDNDEAGQRRRQQLQLAEAAAGAQLVDQGHLEPDPQPRALVPAKRGLCGHEGERVVEPQPLVAAVDQQAGAGEQHPGARTALAAVGRDTGWVQAGDAPVVAGTNCRASTARRCAASSTARTVSPITTAIPTGRPAVASAPTPPASHGRPRSSNRNAPRVVATNRASA